MTEPSERIRRLQAIAQQAAQPEEEATAGQTALTFILAGERYALPLEEVREVIRIGHITPLPGLPPAVLGATGLRGNVLPVIGTARLMGLEASPATAESRLVVVEQAGQTFALLADQVEDITVLPSSALHPPAEAEGRTFVRAIAGEGPETVRLLDLARLLEAVDYAG